MPRRPSSAALDSLLVVFGEVPDPRLARTRAHPLVNVLTMSLFGAICGCDGWDALDLYASEHADFFATFLEMRRGTPCADTFRRVFEALDPRAFQEAFRRWLQPFLDEMQGQTVALDGKTLRGALAQAAGRGGAFHLMQVWAAEHGLLLAQKAIEHAPGEVQAGIELLGLLDLHGATVTADANSCSAAVTQAVRDAGADYVLALKGNRSALHDHVEKLFAESAAAGFKDVPRFDALDQGHGRVDYRVVRAMALGPLPPRMSAAWADLRSAVQIDRVRFTDHITTERHFYISSHPSDPELLARRIRAHWSIENHLHHCLDVTFDEDRRRIHSENGAQNFALVSRYALSLLKREPSKMSVAMKRRKAAWNKSYVLDVLAGGFLEV